MSSFFGTSSPGSGSNANGSSSNSGSGGGGGSSGGGGWGSFLKQGLSSIESKIDMVLDIQVPIPGGATGALTSFSPHANILPSSITGAPTTKDTPPKRQASPQAPSTAAQGDSRNSQEVNSDDERGKKSTTRRKTSTQDLRKSVVGAKALQDDSSRRSSSQSEDMVTVDPFTGMVTTAPGVKRMSTPPVSSGMSSSAAAAAAAAANRERLEQRMRGIFKKPTDSPPTTPPPSMRASPSPSARKSDSTDLNRKGDDLTQQDDAEETESKVTPTKVEKPAQEGDAEDSSATHEDKSEQEPKTAAPAAPTADDAETTKPTSADSDADNDNLEKTAGDVVDEQEPVKKSPDSVVIKDDTYVDPTPEAEVKTSTESIKAAKPETTAESSNDQPHTAEDVELPGTPKQEETQETTQDETPAEVDVSATPFEQPSTHTSSEDDIVIPISNDRPDTPLSTTESDQATTDAVKIEPITTPSPTKDTDQTEAATKNVSSTADVNPLKRVLDQREEQLFKIMQEQSTLIEKLRDLEDAKAAEDARNAVKLAGLEKMIETQKKELEVARGSNLVSQPKSIQKTLEEQRGLLEEKDEQIRGLLAEGEVLSKKEFKHLTTIKTLRMKTIEMEKIQMDTQKKMDKVAAECTEAQSKVTRLTDENKQLQESVRSLHDINQRQNKQATKVEAELIQLREDKANLQMGLDRAWQELAEARKASAELSSQTHAAALEREMKMNEDLHEQLDSLKTQHAAVESNFRQDIQELRVSLSNREELAGEKEDQLYMEIRNLQARLEQKDHDSYELQETLDEARRPLLHQIEILQNQQGVSNRNWDKVEKSLARRISEAEENTTKAQERERAARDKLDEVKSQIIALEARLETLRIADTQLRSDMNTNKRALAEKEDAARQAQAELSRERLNRERAVEEAKEDVERKWHQQQHAEVEKLKAQIQQLQQQRPNTHSSSDGDLLSATSDSIHARRPSSSSVASVNSPMLGGGGAMAVKMAGALGRTSFESITSPTSLDGMAPSLSRSSSSYTMAGIGAGPGTPTMGLLGLGGGGGSSAGQAVAMERLNAMVRQLEGQVTFLAEQVRSANRNKDELSDELVKVTMELEELQGAASKVPSLEQELTLLKDRHRAALEMLGEKTEEVQELRADILDVKEAYRDQINELLAQLEKLRRANAAH